MAKRLLALLLSVATLCGFMQFSAFASNAVSQYELEQTTVSDKCTVTSDNNGDSTMMQGLEGKTAVTFSNPLVSNFTFDDGTWNYHGNQDGGTDHTYDKHGLDYLRDGTELEWRGNSKSPFNFMNPKYISENETPDVEKYYTDGTKFFTQLCYTLKNDTFITDILVCNAKIEGIRTGYYELYVSNDGTNLFSEENRVFVCNNYTSADRRQVISFKEPVEAKFVAIRIFDPYAKNSKSEWADTNRYIRLNEFNVFGTCGSDLNIETAGLSAEPDYQRQQYEELMGDKIKRNLLSGNLESVKVVENGSEVAIDAEYLGKRVNNASSTNDPSEIGIQSKDVKSGYNHVLMKQENGVLTGVSDNENDARIEYLFKLDGPAVLSDIITASIGMDCWRMAHVKYSFASKQEDLFTENAVMQADVYSNASISKLILPNNVVAQYVGIRLISIYGPEFIGTTLWSLQYESSQIHFNLNGAYLNPAIGDITVESVFDESTTLAGENQIEDAAIDNNDHYAIPVLTKKLTTEKNFTKDDVIYLFTGWYEGDQLLSEEPTYLCPVTAENRTITAKYKQVDCLHEHTELRNFVMASCNEEGYSGDIVCMDCNNIYQKGKVTQKNSNWHVNTYKKSGTAVASTCTVQGHKEDLYCRICGRKAADGDPLELDPKNHQGTKSMVGVREATCVKTGYSGYEVCDDCHAVIKYGNKTPIEPANHGNTYEKSEAIAATCVSQGKTAEIWCKDCNQKVSDSKTIAKDPENHVKIAPKENSYVLSTCVDHGHGNDYYCTACNKKIFDGVKLELDPDHHVGTKSIVNKKAATCTGKGYTGDTKCDDCGAIITKGKETPALGHKAGNTVVTKATAAKNGKIAKICATCKKTISSTTIYKAPNVKLSTVSYTYNGKAKTPTVTVKDSKGKTLKKNTDYTVSYAKGRKYVGKYAVKVTFKGNFSGTKALYFKINPKGTKLSSVTSGKKQLTAKWSAQKSQTDGYQIQYSSSKSFKGAKTLTVSGNKTTDKTIRYLVGGKTYYVRVRTFKKVGNIRYYSSWSSVKSAAAKK